MSDYDNDPDVNSLQKSFTEAVSFDKRKMQRLEEEQMRQRKDLETKHVENIEFSLKGAHKSAAMTAVMLKNRPVNSKSQFINLWSLLNGNKLLMFEKFYQKVNMDRPKLISHADARECLENARRCTSVFPRGAEYCEWVESYRRHYGTRKNKRCDGIDRSNDKAGFIIEASYRDGRKHGMSIEINSSNQIEVYLYKNGGIMDYIFFDSSFRQTARKRDARHLADVFATDFRA